MEDACGPALHVRQALQQVRQQVEGACTPGEGRRVKGGGFMIFFVAANGNGLHTYSGGLGLEEGGQVRGQEV